MADSPHILLVGVNWIGDAVMSMPAIQAFRRAWPAARLSLLLKPGLMPLWSFHAAPDQLIEQNPRDGAGTIRRLREQGPFIGAYILPHSIRSAWYPWRAGVPRRVATPGAWRRLLVNEVRGHVATAERCHQVFEYYDVLLPDQQVATWEAPQLAVPASVIPAAVQEAASPCVALLPGAARGPSKQWPADHFVALGQRIVSDLGGSVIVLGTAGERALCEQVATGIGAAAINLAGQTDFATWLGCLAGSAAVVANDSGGMHVAAALQRPLVALYGITDPAITGPLSRTARILQKTEQRSRDVPRISAQAAAALAAITPDEAFAALCDVLDAGQETC
jgi:heptosyltransferase-2